jgi:hypothetical protein
LTHWFKICPQALIYIKRAKTIDIAPTSPSIIPQDISSRDDNTAFEVFFVDETGLVEDGGVDSTAVVVAALSVLVPVPVVLTTCDGLEVVLNTAEDVLVSTEEVIVVVAAALGRNPRPPVIVTAQTSKEKGRISERKVWVAANE